MLENPALTEKFVLRILGALVILGFVLLGKAVKNKGSGELKLFRNTYLIAFGIMIIIFALFNDFDPIGFTIGGLMAAFPLNTIVFTIALATKKLWFKPEGENEDHQNL